jgi:hypothetical protein
MVTSAADDLVEIARHNPIHPVPRICCVRIADAFRGLESRPRFARPADKGKREGEVRPPATHPLTPLTEMELNLAVDSRSLAFIRGEEKERKQATKLCIMLIIDTHAHIYEWN